MRWLWHDRLIQVTSETHPLHGFVGKCVRVDLPAGETGILYFDKKHSVPKELRVTYRGKEHNAAQVHAADCELYTEKETNNT